MSEDEKKSKKANDERQNNSADHLRLYKEEATAASAAQAEAYQNVKKISNKNSNWTITQELLQEIMAAHTVADPEKLPPLTDMVEQLKEEIERRYQDEPGMKDILLKSIPAMRSVREWVKKEGWDEAVWGYIRVEGLFSAANRAKVIKALGERAIDRSDAAAKIWLTLSGDYSEKMEVDNKSVDIYREINSILHNNKKKNET
jgi:hypothetical protein